MFLLLFHLSVVALNSYAIWYDQNYVDLPFPSEDFDKMLFKARGIFLTFWCLITQTAYFTVALLNDVIGSNATAPKNPPLIRKIKDTLFSLAFTMAIYVATAFWCIYFINKDFIFPVDVKVKFPSWLNHTMHTFIVPFILMELFLSARNYPSRSLGISAVLSYSFAYIFCLLAVYFTTGLWVYPFLNMISWPMKLLYFVSSTAVGMFVYILGEKLNSLSYLNIRVTYTNGKARIK